MEEKSTNRFRIKKLITLEEFAENPSLTEDDTRLLKIAIAVRETHINFLLHARYRLGGMEIIEEAFEVVGDLMKKKEVRHPASYLNKLLGLAMKDEDWKYPR